MYRQKAGPLSVPEIEQTHIGRLTEAIRIFSNGRRIVVGVSGGVDSALTTALAVKAVGSSGVLGVVMPDTQVTPKPDVEDAISLLQSLGVEYKFHPIDEIVQAFRRVLNPSGLKELGNVKARSRMIILYYYANLLGGLVAGTGDRSEILLGYFTKFGDGAADFLPIGSLYKTQVRQAALLAGLPQAIAMKPSSPRLWEGQTAEKELGANYELLDPIIYGLVDLKRSPSDIIGLGYERAIVERVNILIQSSVHKRTMPPVIS